MKQRILLLAAVAAFTITGAAFAAGEITGGAIKDSSITGRDVKNRSLTRKDFRGSVRGRRGRTGPAGPVGVQGPQGPPGPASLGKLVRVESPQWTVAAGDVDGVSAVCPAGHNVVSGGFQSVAADGEVFVDDSFGSANSWSALLDNFDSSIEGWVVAVAFCAPAGQAVTASRRVSRPVKRRIERAIAAMRAVH
jgi:hypothetical protein